MKNNVTINGLELTEKRIDILSSWFENPESETRLEFLVSCVDSVRDVIVQMLCDDANEENRQQLVIGLQDVMLIKREFALLI